MLPHLFPRPITISSLFCSVSPPWPFPTAPDCQEIPPAAARSVTAPQSYLLMAYMSTMVQEEEQVPLPPVDVQGWLGVPSTGDSSALVWGVGQSHLPLAPLVLTLTQIIIRSNNTFSFYFYFFKVFLKQQVLICYRSMLQQSAA